MEDRSRPGAQRRRERVGLAFGFEPFDVAARSREDFLVVVGVVAGRRLRAEDRAVVERVEVVGLGVRAETVLLVRDRDATARDLDCGFCPVLAGVAFELEASLRPVPREREARCCVADRGDSLARLGLAVVLERSRLSSRVGALAEVVPRTLGWRAELRLAALSLRAASRRPWFEPVVLVDEVPLGCTRSRWALRGAGWLVRACVRLAELVREASVRRSTATLRSLSSGLPLPRGMARVVDLDSIRSETEGARARRTVARALLWTLRVMPSGRATVTDRSPALAWRWLMVTLGTERPLRLTISERFGGSRRVATLARLTDVRVTAWRDTFSEVISLQGT